MPASDATRLKSLLLYDLARLRAWFRQGAVDPSGTLIAVVVTAAAAVAVAVACHRLGRSVAQAPFELAGLAAGVGGVAVATQAGMGRVLSGGPLEALLPFRRVGAVWTGLRAGVLGTPFLVALLLGAMAGGADAPALAGAMVAALAGVCLCALAPMPPPTGDTGGGETRSRPSRISDRVGLWSLAWLPMRERGLGAPRWSVALATAAVGGWLARLATANGGTDVGAAAVLAGAAAAGACARGLDADLLSALAVTRQPLWKLIALFAAGPLLLALAAGGLIAAFSGLPAPLAFAAVGAGATLVALWTATDVLNLIAHGASGPVRTLVYFAVAVLLLQAAGPFGLAALPVAGWALFRLAARRRWRTA